MIGLCTHLHDGERERRVPALPFQFILLKLCCFAKGHANIIVRDPGIFEEQTERLCIAD